MVFEILTTGKGCSMLANQNTCKNAILTSQYPGKDNFYAIFCHGLKATTPKSYSLEC